MRIVEPSTLAARPLDAFGSEGFSMAGLSRGAQVVIVEADGLAGRLSELGA